MSIPITDRLPATSVLRILGVLLIVCAPHLPRLPLWAAGTVLAIGLWRGLAAVRGWTLPSGWLRIPLTLALFIGVSVAYGGIRGQNAGVALLVVMTAMKLTEMGARRDYTLTIFLAYFLLITHFLYSQEIVMIGYLLLSAVAVTAVLVELNHSQSPLPLRVALKHSGLMVAQAIPIMLAFFVLFPRIPGPIWGLPADAGAGTSGLSDRMEPGSISQLSQSDAVAFRVTFDGQAPPRDALYWRGPVFWHFDGRAWGEGITPADVEMPKLAASGDSYDYELVLEPHGRRWLFALELFHGPLPLKSTLSFDHLLLSKDRVIDRKLLRLSARNDFVLEPELGKWSRIKGLRLPSGTNPRTRALGESWRDASGGDAREIARQALHYFRTQPFVYTLRPPLLSSPVNAVDEFLFGTRRGFCEHYAGAFTVLMRAAGIPARVVTGYQGGALHEAGGYYIVRQSDAHAWTEIWIEDEGWLRVDPTGAVAPQRIELGLGSLPEGEPVPGLARLDRRWIEAIQLRWDMVNAGWNRWVLAYGPELQQELLRVLGLPGIRQAIIALTVITIALLTLFSALMVWRSRPVASADLVWRDWNRFRRKLRRRGVAIDPSEGPRDFGARIAREKPALAQPAQDIVDSYIRLRYAGGDAPQLRRGFRRQIRRFPRR